MEPDTLSQGTYFSNKTGILVFCLGLSKEWLEGSADFGSEGFGCSGVWRFKVWGFRVLQGYWVSGSV